MGSAFFSLNVNNDSRTRMDTKGIAWAVHVNTWHILLFIDNNTVVSIHFHSVKTFYFCLPNHMILMECFFVRHWTSDVNVHNGNSNR